MGLAASVRSLANGTGRRSRLVVVGVGLVLNEAHFLVVEPRLRDLMMHFVRRSPVMHYPGKGCCSERRWAYSGPVAVEDPGARYRLAGVPSGLVAVRHLLRSGEVQGLSCWAFARQPGLQPGAMTDSGSSSHRRPVEITGAETHLGV